MISDVRVAAGPRGSDELTPVAIVAALVIGELFVRFGAAAVVVPCAWLWAQLYTLGLLNEGRDTAFRIELIRLLFATPMLFLFFQQTAFAVDRAAGAWLVLAAYVIVSTLGLLAVSEETSAHGRSLDGRS